MKKRFVAMLLALIMVLGLLPVTAMAANWNPNDKITITVRVFDPQTGGVWTVGTDTCTKGDQYIQSDPYVIPNLSKFAPKFTGSLVKVTGNWYFPTSDQNVNGTVYWSCNANSATMTYWVNGYVPDGAHGDKPSGGDEHVEEGSGRYSANFTIVYHSNYPDGTDYTKTYTYTVRANYNVSNSVRIFTVKTLTELGFSVPNGYRIGTPPWKTGAGESVNNIVKVNPNSTTHLYAQWVPSEQPAKITLTYMNGSEKYAEMSYFAGDTVTVIDCTATKEGYTFKGWDSYPAANDVKYKVADTFTINESKTLYAVWEAQTPAAPTLPKGIVKVHCEGDDTHDHRFIDEVPTSFYEGTLLSKDESEDGKWHYTVSFKRAEIIKAYNDLDEIKATGIVHEDAEDPAPIHDFEYIWENNKWELKDSATAALDIWVTVNVKHPDEPIDPETRLSDFACVRVDCSTEGHDEKLYPLEPNEEGKNNSYTITYTYDTDGTTITGATVTIVDKTPYIAKYDTEIGTSGHAIDTAITGKDTIELSWNAADGEWSWREKKEVNAAYIPLKCGLDKPTDNDIQGEGKGFVIVDCTNTEVSHSETTMDVKAGTYSVGEVNQTAKTCVITITSLTEYANAYKPDDADHTAITPTTLPTFTLKYNNGKWELDGNPAKIHTECTTPKPIPDPSGTNTSFMIDLECVTTGSHHLTQSEWLKDGYTFVKPVTTENGETTCTIKVLPEAYLEEYKKTYPEGHSAQEEFLEIDLVYNAGIEGPRKWTLKTAGSNVFHVECYNTFTLKYDANGGSGAPAEQTYNGPETSHKFTISNTVPTRANYTFLGWADTANATSANVVGTTIVEVANGTKAGVKTIYAVWKENITPPVNYTLTLKYDANGGSGAPTDDVYVGPNASNVFTVSNVEPTRANYTFLGWADTANATRANVGRTVTVEAVTGTTSGEKTIYAVWSWNYYPIYQPVKATPKFNTTDHFAYVQGYPNGSVKPTGNITRAETAAILFRLMDEGTRNTYYSTKSGFRDVSSNNWFNTYVATLNAAGVITDSANGYFRPNDAITRAELAAMLAQFADTKSAANYFNDVAANHWAANAIAVCAKLGWINGYPDGSFRPDNYITRAELMAMINRATGRTPKTADAFLNGMKTWTDNLDTTKWYYVDVQEATNSHDYIGALNEKWTALRSAPNWSIYE